MLRAFKLSAPQPLESDFQRQIVDYLRYEQARGRIGPFCRLNGGKARLKGFWVSFYRLFVPGCKEATTGYADLHGIYGRRSGSPGRYFALEVKQPGEVATPAQRAYLAAVREDGGVAATVWSFTDVKNVLFGEIDVHAVEDAREKCGS